MHGWPLSSHARSNAQIHGRAVDPRERSKYDSIEELACASCHKIHGAGRAEHLLRFNKLDNNCSNCHDGGVARQNIAGEMRKRSAHTFLGGQGAHDPTENPRTTRQHVVCVDCHNPHAVAPDITRVQGAPTLGLVGNTTRFVKGMDRSGRLIDNSRFEYEICLKCHSYNFRTSRLVDIVRQIQQVNTRIEFQTSNPSYHPVIGPRNNREVVSLIPPMRVGSVIRCTDCHNSDQADSGGPRGPHGSIYEPLLIDNYETDDFVTESARAYALCYRCHDRQSILGNESFPFHNQHIVRGRASCSACHDAHGISRAQGNSRNNSNLINFDRSIVQPASGALGSRIEFVDLGPGRGNCTLTCHGVTHVRLEYGR
jgi:hypothetical protein